MVVTGTNGGSFCEDFGSIVLSELAGTVTVTYTITHYREGVTATEDTLVETYTPDEAGQVRINDLGKLAQCYFDPLPLSLNATLQHTPWVLIEMVVADAGGNSIGSLSQRFFYANCRTNIAEAYTYRGFLTRHRRTKVRGDQTVSLGFFNHGQSLYVGVSYRSGILTRWKEQLLQAIADDGLLTVYNLNVATVAAAAGLDTSEVDYYIVYLKADGEVVDAVQFNVDHRFFPVLTHFAYYNCFGVPETLFFTGQDNRSTEMNATYARIGHHYHKIQTDYNVYHEVNTGYINEVLRDCVEDLVNSKRVWKYDATGLGDMITVTAVSFDESKPRTEPINVRFTYRIANECQRKVDRDTTVDYRIFDHTFGIEFE